MCQLVLTRQLAQQPPACQPPVAQDRVARHVKRFSRLFHAQPAKIPQLHDLTLSRVDRRQRLERVVERDDFATALWSHDQ